MRKDVHLQNRLIFSVFFLCFFAAVSIRSDAQESQKPNPDTRYAERYLLLAQDCFAQGAWDNAVVYAKQGLEYDAGISDLWYVLAAAGAQNARKIHEILPLIETAYNTNRWLGSKDSARIFFADLLYITGRPERAIEALDSYPALISADAIFIRAKSFYKMNTNRSFDKSNTAQSLDAARAQIATARELYPDDERFLLCFFVQELSKTDYRTDEALRDYAKEYVDTVIQDGSDDAELTIYAAAFADGQERIRLLKSFYARRLFHPLYALFALEDSLFDSADGAFEYFTNEIAKNGSIEKTLFEVFFSRLQAPPPIAETAADGALTQAVSAAAPLPSVVEKAKKYLRDFSFTIFEDTDNDGIENMRVLYERGRPLFAEYDSNQDGSAELQVQCDYGTPKTAAISKDANLVQLVYGTYPYIKSARMNGIDFEFPNARLAWYPLDLYVSSALFDSSLNASFYIGQKNNTADILSERLFFASASRVSCMIPESASGHKNAKAVFSFLRGKPLRAEYFSHEKMYAAASFENGIIKNRSVDTTGDGIFDVTEEFGYNEATAQKYFKSVAEKEFLYKSLFGNIAAADGVYVAKVARDTNGDRINDYVEEFAPDTAGNIAGNIVKTSYWDNDADGKWDCGYKTQGDAITESFFRSYEIGSTKAVITRIFSENGVPYRVISDKGEYAVTFDRENGFYWLGAQSANRNDSAALASAFSGELAFQYGCAIVISADGTKLMARHIAQYKFGELLE